MCIPSKKKNTVAAGTAEPENQEPDFRHWIKGNC